jgi:hypothetical protein
VEGALGRTVQARLVGSLSLQALVNLVSQIVGVVLQLVPELSGKVAELGIVCGLAAALAHVLRYLWQVERTERFVCELQALLDVQQDHCLEQLIVWPVPLTVSKVVPPLVMMLCEQGAGVSGRAEDQDGHKQVPDLRAHLGKCCVLECLIPLSVIL